MENMSVLVSGKTLMFIVILILGKLCANLKFALSLHAANLMQI